MMTQMMFDIFDGKLSLILIEFFIWIICYRIEKYVSAIIRKCSQSQTVKNIAQQTFSHFSATNQSCTRHGILHYVWSADLLINLLMLFSTDYVNFYLFSISFAIDWKVWGYPTLFTLWFINFNEISFRSNLL